MRHTPNSAPKSSAALTAILLGLTIFATAPRARAQLTALDKVPQGADAVLIIPSLSQLSGDIAQLAQALNLSVPPLSNPLRTLKLSMGVKVGLDENGALLAIVPDLARAMTQQREPKLLVLVPVSDYQAFIGNFKPQGVQDAPSLSLLIVRDRQRVYAKKAAGYAVLSPSKKLVQNYQPAGASEKIANKIGAAGRRYLEQSDVMFYMDMQAMQPALLEMINKAMDQVRRQAQLRREARRGNMPRKQFRNVQAIAQAYAEAGRAIVKSTTGLLLGLDISDQGVGLTGAAGFTPDSALAAFFPGAGQETQRPHALAWLPDQTYVVAGAWNTNALTLEPILKDMLNSGFMKLMPDQMVEMYRKNLAMVRHVNAMSFAFYPFPQQPRKKGAFFTALTVIDVDNPQQYVATLKQNIQSMDGMKIPLRPAPDGSGNAERNQPGKGEDGSVATYTTSYTENALKISGVQVDKYHVKVDFPPQMMQGIGATEAFILPFLQQFTSVTGYIATKGGKVLQTTSTHSQLLADALQAIEGAGGLGQTGPINEVRDRALPPSPAAQAYLSFNGLAQLAKPFMAMMGMPRIQVPDDLPPFAAGLGVEQSSMVGRVYFPMQTIQFLSETTRDVMKQMTGP